MNTVLTIVSTLVLLTGYCDGKCDPTKWAAKGNKTNIILIKEKMNYDDARDHCMFLGGDLLTITDVEDEEAVKSWMESNDKCKEDEPILLGLKIDKDFSAEWSNGLSLATDDYTNTKSSMVEGCIKVKWCESPLWIPSACEEKHYFICEASEPCIPVLSMEFNDKKMTKNSTQKMRLNKDVDMACKIYGDSGSKDPIYADITLMCGSEKRNSVESVAKSFVFRVSLHNKICSCKAILEDNTELFVRMKVNIQGGPKLLTKGGVQTISATQGHDLDITFFVISNPRPTDTYLTRNRVNLTQEEYFIKFHSTVRNIQLLTQLHLENVEENEGGVYRVHLNGIDGPTEYTFNVKVTSDIQRGIMFTVAFILGVPALYFGVLIFCNVWKYEPPVEEEAEAEETEHASQQDKENPDEPPPDVEKAAEENEEARVSTPNQ